MKYICEICNKQYDTVAEAEKCELAHRKTAAEESVKTTAETKISDAVNAYIAKYKEFPNVDITPENQKFIIGDFTDRWEKTLDTLIDLFFEDGEDDGKCDCGKCDCGKCDCNKSGTEQRRKYI